MLSLDPTSTVAPFQQVREQIATQIASGQLEAGTRLPSVRRLAADLGVASGTVARAYRELEHAGLVRTNRRTGTTVAPAASTVPVSPEIQQVTRTFVLQVRAHGLSDPAIVQLVQECVAGSRRTAGAVPGD